MNMKLVTPTKILLPEESEKVRRFLTYVDKSVGFQISKLKQNYHFKRNNPEAFLERVEALKEQQNQCLLFHDDKGNPWTYSGLWRDLRNHFGWGLENLCGSFSDEDLDLMPWKKVPHKMRNYQEQATNALIESGGHGAIELPTGSGKTLIIMNLLKRYPVKTLIITPYTNITTQLRKDLESAFGVANVGQLGDGRKKVDKLFTVANAQSATKITPGSKEWEVLSKCKMVIFDESHMVPAESFKNICLNGVAGNSKLRFFLSATQTRTDGSDLLLKGITGPVVFRKTYKELAEEKFLKQIKARVFKIPPARSPVRDPKKETRANLYENPNAARLAAMLAEKAFRLANRQVVILIEEYSQFLLLKNHMKIPYEFAHGSVSQDAKKVLPEEYWKCDVADIVDQFNKGNLPCMIGTTAISTGVDIKPTGCVIYLQGGKSEIKVKQGIGRGTRPVAHEDLWVCDFKVEGSPTLEAHANARAVIYKELTDLEVDEIG